MRFARFLHRQAANARKVVLNGAESPCTKGRIHFLIGETSMANTRRKRFLITHWQLRFYSNDLSRPTLEFAYDLLCHVIVTACGYIINTCNMWNFSQKYHFYNRVTSNSTCSIVIMNRQMLTVIILLDEFKVHKIMNRSL